MKIKNNKITNLILSLAFFLTVFGIGYKYGEHKTFLKLSKPNVSSEIKNMDFDLFWETLDQVQTKYIEQKKLDSKNMYYGAIKGMVASLEDPYTYFLTPEENKQSKNDLEGKFEGIGANLGLKNNRIIVIAPLKDSPAEKAGVKAGDYIVKVDDKPTRDLTLAQAVSKIRGKKGERVKLTLERNGKEKEVSIVRDQIKVDSVNLYYFGKAAQLQVNQFGENTNEEWDEKINQVVQKIENGQVSGIILDLRDNPGGYLDSAVYLAGEFLKKNDLVVKQQSFANQEKIYKSNRTGKLTDIKVVVLINEGSASASEILAGTLRDNKKAVLIGEKSFGKGSVQEAVDLSQGAGLHVTVAKWILPQGDWINGKGIEPNVKIENKADSENTITSETDLQLKKAIEIVLK